MNSENIALEFPVMNFSSQSGERVNCLANHVAACRVWRDFVPVRPHLPPKLRCASDSSCILMLI